MVDFTKLFPIQEQAESGGNPLAVSSAGAIGPMQTMPGTLKSPGYGVAAAKDNSIEEQRRVGQDYMKAMVAEYGNLNDALVAYNWGPGNANKWKAAGADPAKLPKETRDYVAKITAQMGDEPIVAGAGRGAVNPPRVNQPTRNVKDDIEAALNKTYQAQVYGKPSTEADFQRGVDEFMKKQSAEIAMEPTQLEAFGAAVAGSPIHSIYKNMTRPRYEPEPGFVPDMAKLPADADTTLVEHFRTARSTAETDEALRHWNDEQLRIRTLSSGGVGNALLRSLGAEIIDPLNILMPWAAAKGLARMGAGSIEAFKAGRVAKGYGAAVLENLVSGTALEAVKQSVEGEFKPADLGVSLLADSLLGIGMGALTHHSVARSLIDNAAVVTLAREADLITRAEKKLGPTATVEELRDEMENLRKGDLSDVVRNALGDVPDSEKLVRESLQGPRAPEPALQLTRYHTKEDVPFSEDKLQGTYFSIDLKERGLESPHQEYGAEVTRMEYQPERPLYLQDQWLEHARFGQFGSGPVSAGIAALKALTEPAEFSRLMKLDKAEAVAAFKARFPDTDISRRHGIHAPDMDAYDVLETYAGQLAKQGGFDSLVLRAAGASEFDEVVVLTPPKGAKGPTTGGSISERKVIATAPVKESLEKALTSPALLNEASPDSRGARQLISHLLTTLPEGVLKQDVNFVGYGARGSFNPVTDVLDTPGRAAGDLMPSNGKVPNEAVILAHEVVHAATAKMIDAVEMGLAGVTKDMHKAVSNLAAIRRDLEAELRKLGKLDKSSEFGANYATKNLHEFVAQVMSDADTRSVLAAMPARGFVDRLTEFAHAVMRLLGFNPKAGNTALQEAVTLIEKVIKEGSPPVERVTVTRTGLNGPMPADVVDELLQDPDFAKYGLTNLPMGTAAQRKEAQAILAIHKKAAVWEQANPMDDAWKRRMKNLSNNTVFNVASTGLTMLSSPSPVVRMLATQLLEDASGVAGKRGATAAIHKYMVERAMLGNVKNDVQRSYEMWKVGKPGGVMDDMVGGKNWEAFNKEIATEIEARLKTGSKVTQDPNITATADSVEAAYQRTANEMRRVNTLGSEGLPASSFGYMPHSMSAKAFINLSNAKQQVVHTALVDQFVSKGWDMSFSDQLASKYLDMARKRAAGDYGTAMGGANAASQVEEALRAMDLPEETVAKHMEKFTKGGANFTKGRLELDLNKVYTVEGEDFRLLDIFETDQIALISSQVGRASGDVALTKFGVRGKPGADLLYNAIQFGEDGKKGGMKELEAYEQVMAEFFNEPYGKSGGKFLERAVLANAWVSMGSAAINQLSEVINGMAHVGFLRSMDAVTSMPRLRRELLAKVKGQSIDNPILDSIEIAGGAEFGTDGYKYVMPFDSPNNLYPTYGQDTPTLVDRVLRGGGHVQAVLSGHRMLSAVQQRGMAEQIVHKMARYIREGKDDIALDQFGIDANLRAKLRQDINQWATFNGDRLVRFEADKITGPEVREAVIQAVWRGTNQIIQGTFIGERGKWAHDGILKMMTQFRSFSITSMEKQWGRQRNSRGTFGAMGIVLGAMSLAWPIHVARTYAQSIGRPDQDEFLETRLSGQHVARATMNYVAGLGMLPDLMDMGTQLLPDSWGVNTTGGRVGTETDFIGNYVAPATGLVDNIWKYAQSPLEAEDAMRIMPFSRLPYVIPLLNNARD